MQICVRCGSQGEPKVETKGSIVTEAALWCLFCLPGAIYSIWRLASRASVCRLCGSPDLVPINSPRGEQLVSQSQSRLPSAPFSNEHESKNEMPALHPIPCFRFIRRRPRGVLPNLWQSCCLDPGRNRLCPADTESRTSASTRLAWEPEFVRLGPANAQGGARSPIETRLAATIRHPRLAPPQLSISAFAGLAHAALDCGCGCFCGWLAGLESKRTIAPRQRGAACRQWRQ